MLWQISPDSSKKPQRNKANYSCTGRSNPDISGEAPESAIEKKIYDLSRSVGMKRMPGIAPK